MLVFHCKIGNSTTDDSISVLISNYGINPKKPLIDFLKVGLYGLLVLLIQLNVLSKTFLRLFIVVKFYLFIIFLLRTELTFANNFFFFINILCDSQHYI